MRYIENLELREWVKDNLRKTIFQKAHALATQTGCEVLVKLQDNADISGCQYYATNNLKKHYRSSKLRRQGEMMVSGETGLPLMDKCTQSSTDSDDDITDSTADPSGRLVEESYSGTDGTMELSESEQYTSVNAQGSQYEGPCVQEDGLQYNTDSDIGSSQIKPELNQGQLTILRSALDIKVEPSDDLEMQQSIDSDNSLLSSGSPAVTSTPSTLSTVPMSGSNMQRYSVPISPKPYQCGVCQKAFRSVQILQKHTRTFHSRPKSSLQVSKVRGKGRVKTSHATQYFSRQLSQEDLEPREYHCVICNQSFHTTDSLHNHVSQVHMASDMPLHQAAVVSHQDEQQATDGILDPSLIQTDPSLIQTDPSLILQAVPSEVMQTNAQHPQAPLSLAGPSLAHQQFPPSLNTSLGSSVALNESGASTSSSVNRRSTCVGIGTWRWSRVQSQQTINTNKKTSQQQIMGAIMLTSGPVSTRTAVNTSGPRVLRGSIPNVQYENAASTLEKANLGYVASWTQLHQGMRRNSVFIKKRPSELTKEEKASLEHMKICSMEEYIRRYHGKTPKCISHKLREELIERGFVTSDQFQSSD